jgi:hypothetical protein
VLVLSSTVTSCYYNCCTDGSTSPGNYGYPLILPPLFLCFTFFSKDHKKIDVKLRNMSIQEIADVTT